VPLTGHGGSSPPSDTINGLVRASASRVNTNSHVVAGMREDAAAASVRAVTLTFVKAGRQG
jgi:hypothetical protein